ncbi:carbohydrate-binding protein [Paenibacillus hexagrammi]|uniref:Carbohydrate-binding protein n=2 Tax=Paenibacillus hexagrammi TaxID=2908839 RepID=A0ABY3SSN4_9BACL|nr:carbohydrate-binding protein [Paenibacillus sp. YPD9-1]
MELCTSRMARVQLSVDGTYRQPDETYYMVQKNDWADVEKTVSDEGTYIKIETKDMVIRVQKSPVRVQMYKKDNITLLSKDADDQGMYWDASTGVRGVKKVEGPGGGGIFGFGTGEKGHSEQLNKYDLDVTDFGMDHGQLIAPFYMSTVGYGIFLNTIDQNTKFFKRGGGFETKDYLDYYFMYGPDFKTILNQYAELTGRMELYGKWAHGFMLSKYGNDNATQAEFLDWLDHLRGAGKYDGQGSYPSDVYVFDYGWRGDKWSPHRWDPTRFPDLDSMFAKADSMGFEVGLHNNKGTPEAKVKDSDPATQGGRFLNPAVNEKWTQAHMDNVIKPGYGDWFWPDEFDIAEGSTHNNWMPTLSTKSVYEAWKNYTDESRPMFITRGSYAGQHFATAWSGDIQNTTEEMGYQIGYGLESGLVGYWTTSHDLGGFLQRPNDNLYTRWVAEFGAWNGIMRAHGHGGREPWTFSSTAQDTLKKNLKIRYALYPYTYSLAWQGYSQGVPMMRPMFLEDGNQNNSKTWDLNRHYYYGDWFLVAPALSESDTMVKLWLPAKTTWYNYYTGQRYEGGESGRDVYVNAKLTDIPVFVKSGAIIPMGPDMNYADEKPLNPLTLDIYPKADTSFTLYEDDGRSRKYITENAYSTTKFDSHQAGNNITFRINKRVTPNVSAFKPVERSYNLKFNHINNVRGVTVNEAPIQAVDSLENFNASSEAYWVDPASGVVYVKTADTGEQIEITLDSDGVVEPALGEEGSAGPVINSGDKFELEQATMKGVTIDTEWKGYTGTGFAKGFKNVGNYVQFTVDIQKAGNYNLILRSNSGKKNDPKYDSTPRQGALYLNNAKVTDFALKVTPTWGDANKNGDWFDYIISDVKLDAGANTLKINVEGSTNPGNYNLDYVRFDYAPKIADAYGTIEAETASTRQGVDVGASSDDSGGYKLNHIENGDWVKFSDVDFGTGGVNGFEARLASGLQGGKLEVWIDSMEDQRAVEMEFGSTGSWNNWETIQAPSQSITGIHDVYLKFVNTESASSILDLNWFRFLKDYKAPVVGAVLQGPAEASKGADFDLDYTLSGLDQNIYAQDLTFTYDPSQLEFVSAESVNPDEVVIVDKAQKQGEIRFLVATVGQNARLEGSLLKLHWKVKSDTQAALSMISLSQALIADEAGHEAEIEGKSYTVQLSNVVIDKTALLALIANAQSKHDMAAEGTGTGQYPAGSKALLLAAIDQAKAVADDVTATREQVEQAVSALTVALQTFMDSVITTQPGDVNDDGRYSIGDLAIVAAAYGRNSADPNWSAYKHADLNNDGKVDIEDLAAMARKILS